MNYRIVDSPVGRLLIAGQNGKLNKLSFMDGRSRNDLDLSPSWSENNAAFPDVVRQLNQYFEGSRKQFEVPISIEAPNGCFNRSVWEELRKIPYGTTCSYKDLAQRIGREKAYRAVGQANHRNPIAIVIPCHRVVGSNGSLTGFGGGISTKKFLLDLEQTYN